MDNIKKEFRMKLMANIMRPKMHSTRDQKENLLQIMEVSTRVTSMITSHTNHFTTISSTIIASMRISTIHVVKAHSKLKKIDCTEVGAIEVETYRH